MRNPNQTTRNPSPLGTNGRQWSLAGGVLAILLLAGCATPNVLTDLEAELPCDEFAGREIHQQAPTGPDAIGSLSHHAELAWGDHALIPLPQLCAIDDGSTLLNVTLNVTTSGESVALVGIGAFPDEASYAQWDSDEPISAWAYGGCYATIPGNQTDSISCTYWPRQAANLVIDYSPRTVWNTPPEDSRISIQIDGNWAWT